MRNIYEKKEGKSLPSFEWYMSYLSPSKKLNMGHVTSEQRYTIEVMLKQGSRQKEIALAIGKDKSVISRESLSVIRINVVVNTGVIWRNGKLPIGMK